MPRVGVEFGYFRRWFGNFQVTDNRATAPADYDAVQHHGAERPAAAGRRRLPVTGLYDLTRTRSGRSTTTSPSPATTARQIEHWNGVDLTVNARPAQRRPAAGRHEHGPDVVRQLRACGRISRR